MEKRKSTGLLLSILGVISLVLITAGVTYAFFSYTKEGTKTNTITAGAITFRYDETSQAGLSLSNALPMSDENGATQTATSKFSFTVESTVPSTVAIPYVVTVRKDASSTFAENQVKIYLKAGSAANSTADNTAGVQTGAVDTTNHTSTVKTFSTLASEGTGDYDWFDSTYKSNVNASNDKIIFTGTVDPTNTPYKEYFDLGMWLLLDNSQNSAMADYSAYEFVKTSAVTAASNAGKNYLQVSSLSRQSGSEEILTSTEYYALGTSDRANYERIAYVNETAGYIMSVTQAGNTATATTTITPVSTEITLTKNEQYYPLNGKTFSVKVNVYSKGTVYTAS